jgi:hypothetical protein
MKIKFSPLLKEIRGKLGETVFRLCHTGEWQITRKPDMRRVRWSRAQDDHRERMAEAASYASCAMDFPELREFYLQMAWEKKRNKRAWDMPSRTISTIASTGWDQVCTFGMQSNGGKRSKNAGNEINVSSDIKRRIEDGKGNLRSPSS